MPSNISELSDHSRLVFAAYANLSSGTSGDAYKNSLISADMSAIQADDFASKWTVIDQFSGALGLSATVFREISSGTRYLAIRGTESLGDFGANFILARGFPPEFNPQFASLRDQINLWTASGALPATFTVAGHSLGGYLASAVALEFGSRVSGVYTYNAPGVDGLFGPIADALRSAVGVTGIGTLSNVTNVRGTAGWSVVAGLGVQIAQPLLIETESSIDPSVNHGIAGLTDSLAVYDLYNRLSPNLDALQIRALVQSASNSMSDSLEKSLDLLRTTVFGDSVLTTGKTATGNREQLYAHLKVLTDSDNYQALIRKVTVGVADITLAIKAKTDFGSFLSLHALSPLVISTTDTTALAKLKQANKALAQQWEADSQLSASERAKGLGNFTNQWMIDRATLLTAITARNTKDGDGLAYSSALPIDRAYDLHWTDASGVEQILIAENAGSMAAATTPSQAPTTNWLTTSTAATATTTSTPMPATTTLKATPVTTP
jgi:pimeloyl-ACP methyl ester carboxylesterase